MADIKANRLFNGNFEVQPELEGHGCEYSTIAWRLVEEAIEISLADLRQLFGRKELHDRWIQNPYPKPAISMWDTAELD